MNLPDIPAAPVEVAMFVLLALASIAAAIRVITASDPFTSALSLIINFVALGTMYLMMQAPFVAMAQILVYAGAVVVLFLFVIAYLGDRRELVSDAVRSRWLRPVGMVVALVFGGLLATVAIVAKYPKAAELKPLISGAWGSAESVGEVFLTEYLLAFEITSLVLLVAAIGGIVLGLTGRARHERLRRMMQTRSADQQRRWYEERHRQGTAIGGADASRRAGQAPAGVAAGSGADAGEGAGE
jgi:NADH-quinone oxidoreductase subunit J